MRRPHEPDPSWNGMGYPASGCFTAGRLRLDAETRRRGEQRGEEAKARGGSGLPRSPGGGASGERGGTKSELRSDASVRSPRVSADSALSGFAFHNGVLRVFLRASASPRQASTRMPGESTFLAMAPLLLALTAGCGYHVSGHGDMLPKTIHTIAIPAFGNVTARYKLARLLPTDIGLELISRTGYRIVAEPNEADAVLTGTVHNFVAYPTISANGRSTTVEAVVSLNLTLTNRATGEVLYNRAGAEFRERYEISIDPKAYFDESGTAMERLSRSAERRVG